MTFPQFLSVNCTSNLTFICFYVTQHILQGLLLFNGSLRHLLRFLFTYMVQLRALKDVLVSEREMQGATGHECIKEIQRGCQEIYEKYKKGRKNCGKAELGTGNNEKNRENLHFWKVFIHC